MADLLEKALKNCIVHAYIHNWPLQPFSQDNGIASHTTLINLIREWRDMHRFLRNLFMAGLFTLRASARNLLRESCRRNIFAFPRIRSRNTILYLLDYCDFQQNCTTQCNSIDCFLWFHSLFEAETALCPIQKT